MGSFYELAVGCSCQGITNNANFGIKQQKGSKDFIEGIL
jgi:hypothetical protein